jgi:hypothetical protein
MLLRLIRVFCACAFMAALAGCQGKMTEMTFTLANMSGIEVNSVSVRPTKESYDAKEGFALLSWYAGDQNLAPGERRQVTAKIPEKELSGGWYLFFGAITADKSSVGGSIAIDFLVSGDGNAATCFAFYGSEEGGDFEARAYYDGEEPAAE